MCLCSWHQEVDTNEHEINNILATSTVSLLFPIYFSEYLSLPTFNHTNQSKMCQFNDRSNLGPS